MDPVFSEYEKRFLLTEILKASHVSLDSLLHVIREENIPIKWDEICFPYGRTQKSCAEAFNSLFTGQQQPVHHAPTTFMPLTSRKRRLSASDQPVIPVARELKSKPPAPNGEHLPAVIGTPGSAAKKRGRPSKETILARQAEAAARGEVYPPLKPASRKSSGVFVVPSVPSGGNIVAAAPQDSKEPSPPVKRKRGRPSSVKQHTEEPADEAAEPAEEQLVVAEEGSEDIFRSARAAYEMGTRLIDEMNAASAGSGRVATVRDSIESSNTMIGE